MKNPPWPRRVRKELWLLTRPRKPPARCGALGQVNGPYGNAPTRYIQRAVLVSHGHLREHRRGRFRGRTVCVNREFYPPHCPRNGNDYTIANIGKQTLPTISSVSVPVAYALLR